MEEDVVVDREMLRAINADSRISILKALLLRQKTQSELAAEIGISAPSVLEHVAQLEKAKLVEIVPEYADRKWKYYRLTRTGRGLAEGRRMSVVLLLTGLCAAITGALIMVYLLFPAIMGALQGAPYGPGSGGALPPAGGGGTGGLQYALGSLESTSRTFIGALAMLFLLLTLALGAAHALGAIMGRMLRKKA
jgi:DNA-binding MarR family transcriptional regulator